MTKKIAVLGSTGSVGTQTLDIIRQNQDKFELSAVVAYANKTTLKGQKDEFNTPFAGLVDDTIAENDGFCYGESVLKQAVDLCDTVVVATRGIIALDAVIYAIKSGKTVALANKEVLVCAGKLISDALKQYGGKIIPVDSEHSALFQCGANGKDVKKLILTASGGAFWGKTKNQLKNVTPKQALNHPRWNMGKKITIDSATLINKGFEVIEAAILFDKTPDDVQVVIHPQSYVHSMVEYTDGAVIAQIANTDMKLPISYALSYPERVLDAVKPFDFSVEKRLDFLPADSDLLKGIQICRDAYAVGKNMPCVVCAADEVAVDYFLNGKISFLDIYDIIYDACDYYINKLKDDKPNKDDIVKLFNEVKLFTKKSIEDKKCC